MRRGPIRPQPRRFWPAAVPIGVGLAWLTAGAAANAMLWLIAVIPAVVLIATGGAQLLWPGDRPIVYHMALGAPAAAVLALLLWPWLGLVAGAALIIGALASFYIAGLAALSQHAVPSGVDRPAGSARLVREVATDSALLGFFINCARIPKGADAARDLEEIAELGAISQARRWAEAPTDFHAVPDAPTETALARARAGGHDFEWLTFASGYRPDTTLPGATRWQAQANNHQMAARVLRHPDHAPGRAWLLCIHGYRMGAPAMDLALFDAAHYHRRHGCNLICPILPLHGVRRATRLTGGLFLDGPLVDLLHAQAQSLWDIRRCIAWIRARQPDATIGTLGFSLGAYNAALLTAFEPDLACVIAGIPLTDIAGVLWQHMPANHRRYLAHNGVTAARIHELLAPVSPLHAAPRIAVERRFIFAATADQIVPPDQAQRLAAHWNDSPIHWYHGSHLSVRREPTIRPFIDRALARSGVIAAGGGAL